MADVVSKNLYELLGNTHDEDSDKEPEPPVKVVDRTPARTDKRSAPREAPGAPANAAPRRGPGGNEGAYRDRNAGSANNRTKPTEDRTAGTYGGRGGRGGQGRGGRGGPRQNDRHSRAVVGDADKQVAHGWGGETGEAAGADEVAGEALAKADGKVALTEDGDAPPVNADGRTPEEEEQDNSVSYADYLIAQAEKLSLSASASRKANEGTKEDKKWATASAVKKQEEEEFIAAAATKAKRARERKQKEVVEIDQRFVEQPSRDSGRGGRGRGDGPRRGGDRGERGNFRGERGAFRGPRGDGAPRGGRGGPRGGAPRAGGAGGGAARGGAPINTEDQKAFPSLGA